MIFANFTDRNACFLYLKRMTQSVWQADVVSLFTNNQQRHDDVTQFVAIEILVVYIESNEPTHVATYLLSSRILRRRFHTEVTSQERRTPEVTQLRSVLMTSLSRRLRRRHAVTAPVEL